MLFPFSSSFINIFSHFSAECSCTLDIAVIITFVILGCVGGVLFVIYRKRTNTQRNKEVEKQNGKYYCLVHF